MIARTKVVLLAILLGAVLGNHCPASTIRGSLISPRGYAIKTVEVRLAATGGPSSRVLMTTSDSEGRFQFENVAPGSYDLEFRKEGWIDANRTVRVLVDSSNVVEELPPIQLQLTTLYQFFANLQAGSVVYVVLIGLATLAFNFYLVPEPSRGVTIAGWTFLAIAVGIAALKLEWADAFIWAFVGGVAAYTIQRFGRRHAALRLKKEGIENSEQAVLRERERSAIESLVGQEGITLTELKTCGSIQVAGRVLDARSSRGYVAPDTRVVVRRIEGKTPIVEVLNSERR